MVDEDEDDVVSPEEEPLRPLTELRETTFLSLSRKPIVMCMCVVLVLGVWVLRHFLLCRLCGVDVLVGCGYRMRCVGLCCGRERKDNVGV